MTIRFQSILTAPACIAACWASMLTLPAMADETICEATVGMSARIEQLVLPGPELEPAPIADRRQPIVLRITGVRPHGTAFRYDIEFYGLEPGRFDLKDYLRRKDDSPAGDLPPIPVEVRSVLPADEMEPNPLAPKRASWLRGYRLALIVGGAAWLAGLIGIVAAGRRKRQAQARLRRPVSLAERLRPLIQAAQAGTLSEQRRAELERLLLAFWRQRLGLEGLDAADALAALRQHEVAGRLVRQLEAWLHAPAGNEHVDVAELLAPYADLPAESPEPEPDEAAPVP